MRVCIRCNVEKKKSLNLFYYKKNNEVCEYLVERNFTLSAVKRKKEIEKSYFIKRLIVCFGS